MQETQEEHMPLSDMKEKLREMNKRLMTLEWDKSHNQLNSSMELKYSQIKVDFEALRKKVESMQAELKEHEAEAPRAAAVAAEVKQA